MLARATFRAASAPSLVARRGFQSTRAQLSSPYHYPEGPRSNLPFDPLKKGFAFKYWGFMGRSLAPPIASNPLTQIATGFSLPFLLAGEFPTMCLCSHNSILTLVLLQFGRRRRTNEPRRWHDFRVSGNEGACRIRGGPANDCTRHHCINFIVCVHYISRLVRLVMLEIRLNSCIMAQSPLEARIVATHFAFTHQMWKLA